MIPLLLILAISCHFPFFFFFFLSFWADSVDSLNISHLFIKSIPSGFIWNHYWSYNHIVVNVFLSKVPFCFVSPISTLWPLCIQGAWHCCNFSIASNLKWRWIIIVAYFNNTDLKTQVILHTKGMLSLIPRAIPRSQHASDEHSTLRHQLV